MKKIYTCESFGKSHCGVQRADNEDRWCERNADGIFIVADGISSSSAGGLVAQLAVDLLPEMLGTNKPSEANLEAFEQHIASSVFQLNEVILKESWDRPDLRGMGAAVVIAWLHSKSLTLFHLGDCRAYQFHCGTLTQLTEDHTVSQLLKVAGHNDANRHSDASHHLTRYLGMPGTMTGTIITLTWPVQDTLLLCSDGLHRQLSLREIEQVLDKSRCLERAAGELIAKANASGGVDNVTVLLVQKPREVGSS